MRPIAEEQISAFLENRPGVIARLCAALSERRVSIKALTVLDTHDIGTVRMVVDDIDGAQKALREAEAAFVLVPVVTVPVSNKPGAFARIARTFADAGINIEYVYLTGSASNDPAIAVFRVDNPQLAMELDFDV